MKRSTTPGYFWHHPTTRPLPAWLFWPLCVAFCLIVPVTYVVAMTVRDAFSRGGADR